MSEKNRQHYVPQFSENKKAIRTFNISNSKYIEYASIKDMCQKHNFYGADKKVEDFLNVEIETKASAIIKNILDSNIIPNQIDEEYVHLAMFLLVSEARNLKIAESNN